MITLQEYVPETGVFRPVATTEKAGVWVVMAAISRRKLTRFTTDCPTHGEVEVYEDYGFECTLCTEEENV